MAITVNIVGNATLQLNSATYGLLDQFQPKTPTFDKNTMRRALTGEPSLLDSLTVIESLRVRIHGANVAANKTLINAIETALMLDAPLRQTLGTGTRVFLKYQPSSGAQAYRSEILSGRVDLPQGALAVWNWDALDTEVLVTIERRFFWEYDTEVETPLTNSNGTNTTGGLGIHNRGDGGASKDNYVEIAAVDALGVLPCPMRLVLTNTYATLGARRVYIAHKAQGTPASFTHILEAESATINATYSASAVDALCSNGNKVTLGSVSPIPAAAATLLTWTLSSAQAGYILNQWIRVIARFSTLPNNGNTKMRITLTDSVTGTQIDQSDWVTLTTTDSLQIICTKFFSPNLQGQVAAGAIKIILEGKNSGANGTASLDFIELAPVDGGTGFRFLKPADETLVSIPVSTGVLNDDMINDALFIESRQDVWLAYGGPLMVIPGRLQRLYTLRDNSDGTAAIASTMTIQLFTRPRVLTV